MLTEARVHVPLAHFSGELGLASFPDFLSVHKECMLSPASIKHLLDVILTSATKAQYALATKSAVVEAGNKVNCFRYGWLCPQCVLNSTLLPMYTGLNRLLQRRASLPFHRLFDVSTLPTSLGCYQRVILGSHVLHGNEYTIAEGCFTIICCLAMNGFSCVEYTLFGLVSLSK